MAQEINKSKYIDKLNTYFNSTTSGKHEGFYCIDNTKQNMHVFKKFILALIEKKGRLELQFIDSECFGYSSSWKTSDVYAECSNLTNLNDTLELTVFETRGDTKVPTKYFF